VEAEATDALPPFPVSCLGRHVVNGESEPRLASRHALRGLTSVMEDGQGSRRSTERALTRLAPVTAIALAIALAIAAGAAIAALNWLHTWASFRTSATIAACSVVTQDALASVLQWTVISLASLLGALVALIVLWWRQVVREHR
jgi:hypothetical protein